MDNNGVWYELFNNEFKLKEIGSFKYGDKSLYKYEMLLLEQLSLGRPYLLNYASMLQETLRVEESEVVFLEAIKTGDNVAKERYVSLLILNNCFDEALPYVLELLNDNYDNNYLFRTLSKIYQEMQEYDKSIFYGEKAIEFTPIFAYNELILTYQKLEDVNKANELFYKLWDENEKNISDYTKMALTCGHETFYQELYTELLRRDADNHKNISLNEFKNNQKYRDHILKLRVGVCKILKQHTEGEFKFIEDYMNIFDEKLESKYYFNIEKSLENSIKEFIEADDTTYNVALDSYFTIGKSEFMDKLNNLPKWKQKKIYSQKRFNKNIETIRRDEIYKKSEKTHDEIWVEKNLAKELFDEYSALKYPNEKYYTPVEKISLMKLKMSFCLLRWDLMGCSAAIELDKLKEKIAFIEQRFNKISK